MDSKVAIWYRLLQLVDFQGLDCILTMCNRVGKAIGVTPTKGHLLYGF